MDEPHAGKSDRSRFESLSSDLTAQRSLSNRKITMPPPKSSCLCKSLAPKLPPLHHLRNKASCSDPMGWRPSGKSPSRFGEKKINRMNNMRLLRLVSASCLAFALNASADQNSPGIIEREEIRDAHLIATPGRPLELIINFTKEKTKALADDPGYAAGGLTVAGIRIEMPEIGRVTTSAGIRGFTITPPDIDSAVAILEAISDPGQARKADR